MKIVVMVGVVRTSNYLAMRSGWPRWARRDWIEVIYNNMSLIIWLVCFVNCVFLN